MVPGKVFLASTKGGRTFPREKNKLPIEKNNCAIHPHTKVW